MFCQNVDYINMLHLPPLADPDPRKLAIQLALLSSFNCLSNLPATSRLRAASLAWGEITFSFWGRTSKRNKETTLSLAVNKIF